MRIIRDASEEIEKKIICENCGVELGYLPIDVVTRKASDYSGDYYAWEHITCPKCSYEIEV